MARLAYVDDVKGFRDVCGEALLRRGHDVSLYADGPSFLRDLDAGEEFDLVFLDLGMSEMSGTVVIDSIKEGGYPLKICVASAYVTGALRERLMERGVVACLQKPFELDELYKVVDENVPAGYGETVEEPPREDEGPPEYPDGGQGKVHV